MQTPVQNSSDKLRRLREEVASLQAVKCRMYHEKMQLKNGLPVSAAVPAAVFERVGFCSPAIRAKRMACAHTTARYVLRDAIQELQRLDSRNESMYQHWCNELNTVEDTIHATDHQKGQVEKEYATLLSKTSATPTQLAQKQQLIEQLEQTHSQCVDEMEQVRQRILERLTDFL